MLMVDRDRRYVEANSPARLAFRLSLAEFRQLRIDDLTPAYFLPVLEDYWRRLTESGCVAGPYDIASPAGTLLEVTCCAVADALPGLQLIVFAPVDWSERELLSDLEQLGDEAAPVLTPRELEILQLATEGQNAPMIAEQLVVSTATVRTHFQNIYEKLEVSDRAGAVAKAMRIGLIA